MLIWNVAAQQWEVACRWMLHCPDYRISPTQRIELEPNHAATKTSTPR